jgi:hypothetical protein
MSSWFQSTICPFQRFQRFQRFDPSISCHPSKLIIKSFRILSIFLTFRNFDYYHVSRSLYFKFNQLPFNQINQRLNNLLWIENENWKNQIMNSNNLNDYSDHDFTINKQTNKKEKREKETNKRERLKLSLSLVKSQKFNISHMSRIWTCNIEYDSSVK